MALAFREWIHVSPLQGYQDSLLSFHARKTRRTAMTETYEVARGSDGLHRWRRPAATRLVLDTATCAAGLDGGVR